MTTWNKEITIWNIFIYRIQSINGITYPNRSDIIVIWSELIRTKEYCDC